MFTLTIQTDNAAFGDEPSYELARILAEVASRVGGGELAGTVRDENGNTVGRFTLTLNAVQKGGRR
jgi:hypothetical protein